MSPKLRNSVTRGAAMNGHATIPSNLQCCLLASLRRNETARNMQPSPSDTCIFYSGNRTDDQHGESAGGGGRRGGGAHQFAHTNVKQLPTQCLHLKELKKNSQIVCFIYLICGYYNNAFSAPHVAISGWHAALGRGEIECNWSSFTNTGIDEEE